MPKNINYLIRQIHSTEDDLHTNAYVHYLSAFWTVKRPTWTLTSVITRTEAAISRQYTIWSSSWRANFTTCNRIAYTYSFVTWCITYTIKWKWRR